MADYCWVITYVNTKAVGEECADEKGIAGPRGATEEQIALAKSHTSGSVSFKMYDDDGVHYYTGRIWHKGGENHCDFQPLQDFGTPNAGCTEIAYMVNGKWQKI